MAFRFLYICTHNRCRSILAEAITRDLAKGRIISASAGSQPAGEVHQDSIKYLKERGYSIANLQSQSWHDFQNYRPDAIISLCDQAANEPCPVWFTKQIRSHWGLVDPSKITGTEEEVRKAFYTSIDSIEYNIKSLLELDLEALDATQLSLQLQKLAV